MSILLEAVSFNHNLTSASTDALNIRRNGEQLITPPEWRRAVCVNPEDSPAAYSIFETRGNVITIQAQFKRTDPALRAVEVRAVEMDHARLSGCQWLWEGIFDLRVPSRSPLGDVGGREIRFDAGDLTGFETFTLIGTRLQETGVGASDIEWSWQFRLSPRAPWKEFATTRHRIYTLLRQPQPPWTQMPFQSSNLQLPWTEVLDHACRWAAGAQDQPDAAKRITHSFYHLGGDIVRYHQSTHYTSIDNQSFRCGTFLSDLRLGSVRVNCTDCAMIVSTFANILGCELWQSQMTGFNYNPIMLIGETKWTPKGRFTIHEVAWEDECTEENDVYDACLQVDGDNNPTNCDPDHTPLLPANLRFGLPHERTYRHRLVAKVNTPNAARPRPEDTRRRRSISVGKVKKTPVVDKLLLNSAEDFYNYAEWEKPDASAAPVLFQQFDLPENAFPSWSALRLQREAASDGTAFIESLWQPPADAGMVRFRINIYEGSSSSDARYRLLLFLAGLHSRDIEPPAQREFGEVSFHTPDYSTIIFARHNLAVVLRNAGKQSVPLNEVAALVDGWIERLFRQQAFSGAQAMKRFSIPDIDYFVDTAIPIDVETDDPFAGLPLIYKFVSESGQIYMQDGRVFFRPSQSGEQYLNVFALNKNGGAFRQQLPFHAR